MHPLARDLLSWLHACLIQVVLIRPGRVQNIVGSCDVKFPIRLEGIMYKHSLYSSVRRATMPEQWGLVERFPERILLRSAAFSPLNMCAVGACVCPLAGYFLLA